MAILEGKSDFYDGKNESHQTVKHAIFDCFLLDFGVCLRRIGHIFSAEHW